MHQFFCFQFWFISVLEAKVVAAVFGEKRRGLLKMAIRRSLVILDPTYSDMRLRKSNENDTINLGISTSKAQN